MGMKLTIALVLAVALISVICFLVRRRTEWPVGKPCAVCGAESAYGYDEHAEDFEHIRPMCLKCLVRQLEKDYAGFAGRAVVVEPAAGPPAYVFQPAKEWQASFAASRIVDDVLSLLSKVNARSLPMSAGPRARYER